MVKSVFWGALFVRVVGATWFSSVSLYPSSSPPVSVRTVTPGYGDVGGGGGVGGDNVQSLYRSLV